MRDFKIGALGRNSCRLEIGGRGYGAGPGAFGFAEPSVAERQQAVNDEGETIVHVGESHQVRSRRVDVRMYRLAHRSLAVRERRLAGREIELAPVGLARLDQLEAKPSGSLTDSDAARHREIAHPVGLEPRPRGEPAIKPALGAQVGVVRGKVGNQRWPRRDGERSSGADRFPLLGVGNNMAIAEF